MTLGVPTLVIELALIPIFFILVIALICGAYAVMIGRVRWSRTETLVGVKARLIGAVVIALAVYSWYAAGVWMKAVGLDK